MEKIKDSLIETFMNNIHGNALWKKTGVRTPFSDERCVCIGFAFEH